MSGLHFYKLDLHVHTPASRCYLDKNHAADQIVQAAIDAGLHGIAVTDHNTASWIDEMKKAAVDKGLVIFPGVEISLDQGHIIAIFDPSATQKDIEGLLGNLEIIPDEFGKSETVCTKNVYEVVEKIHIRGGLAILAHIDQPKGLFHDSIKRKDDGKINVPAPLAKVIDEAKYDAIECAEGSLPTGFDDAHQIHRKPAFYQASDNPDPENPTRHSYKGIGSLSTFFSVESINLEGLRQCFSDPDVRICLNENYKVHDHPRIMSLHIGDSGFLRNISIDFHEGLNSLIGGKGVGKSLIIEFIRYGLLQPPRDTDLVIDHQKKLAKRLGIGNKVEIHYQDKTGTNFLVTRTLTDVNRDGELITIESCVNLDSKEEYKGDIPTLLPILAYSQTEVIKIAEDKDAQLSLIDRFIDSHQHRTDLESIQSKLDINDKSLKTAIQARYGMESLKKSISTLDERIAAINKSLQNPLFDEMKKVETKKKLLEKRQGYLQDLIDQLVDWKNKIEVIKPVELSDDDKKDKDLSSSQQICENSYKSVVELVSKLKTDFIENQNSIDKIIEDWLPTYTDVYSKYQTLLTSLGGDLQDLERERIRLEKERAVLSKRLADLVEQSKGIDGVLKERKDLLDQLENENKKFFEIRKTKYEDLTKLSEGKILLEINHATNKTVFEEMVLESLKGGSNPISLTDRRKISQSLMPRRFIQLVLDRNKVHLAYETDLSEIWAERVIEKLWSAEDFSEVLGIQHNCYPSDVPSIKYQKEEGVYGELDELSVGQKCTALLIIALCEGSMPIVIDQPEDALDIASVWEDVSKKLRRGKDSRQFILTTHNSSVAVGSDSDKFIILKAGANSGKVIFTGAIDHPDVRQSVIDHLEGGNEPYNLRAKKYNLPN